VEALRRYTFISCGHEPIRGRCAWVQLPHMPDFLCLLPDPLGFEDPPPGFPVAEQTRRWSDMLAATACFLRSMCRSLSPTTPSQPPACYAPCTTDTATTSDSKEDPTASISSVLLGSPFVSPWTLPSSSVSCRSPQLPCVSNASDQVNDDEVPILCLHVTSPPRPSACAAAASPADSDDKSPIPQFSHPALVSCSW
jgi:hypothetical protein